MSIKITYTEPNLSAFAIQNLAAFLGDASVVKNDKKVEVKDFLNVKMVVDNHTYFGELTICDILARKHNSEAEHKILR